MRSAFVFPGQGSQKVGMGKAWAEASEASAEIFARADEALGFSVSRLCWEGDEADLQLTANTQPAILTVSVAVLAALSERQIVPKVVAGHSLGEYSALVAAGVLTLEDALRLVRRRGELMQQAVPVGEGAMAAILGLESEQVEAVVEEATGSEVCAVANYNSPLQTVIAGHAGAVDRAIELARERGARRAVRVPVSAPFHSPLMAPARDGLRPMLEETVFGDPLLPVISNVDATDLGRGDEAREALIRQIDSPVRWVESVRRMYEVHGVERFVEVGPGGVLTGLIKRTLDGVATLSTAEPSSLEGMGD